MDESPTAPKPKKTLSEEQKRKMAEGKRLAKERRQREKEEKLKQEEDQRIKEYEVKKLKEAQERKRRQEAEQYQKDLLSNHEKDKQNRDKLKANFEKIRAKLLKESREHEEDEEAEEEIEEDKEEEKEEYKEGDKPTANYGNNTEGQINRYVDKVAEIAQQMPDEHTKKLFKEVCDVYDFDKSLSENLTLLMTRADKLIRSNSDTIKQKVIAQRKKEIEEEEKRIKHARDERVQKAQNRLKDLMNL